MGGARLHAMLIFPPTIWQAGTDLGEVTLGSSQGQEPAGERATWQFSLPGRIQQAVGTPNCFVHLSKGDWHLSIRGRQQRESRVWKGISTEPGPHGALSPPALNHVRDAEDEIASLEGGALHMTKDMC